MAHRKEFCEGKFYRIGYKLPHIDGIMEETSKRRAMQIAKDLENRYIGIKIWICKFVRNKDRTETCYEYIYETK